MMCICMGKNRKKIISKSIFTNVSGMEHGNLIPLTHSDENLLIFKLIQKLRVKMFENKAHTSTL